MTDYFSIITEDGTISLNIFSTIIAHAGKYLM